jgi:hypothetical protein
MPPRPRGLLVRGRDLRQGSLSRDATSSGGVDHNSQVIDVCCPSRGGLRIDERNRAPQRVSTARGTDAFGIVREITRPPIG